MMELKKNESGLTILRVSGVLHRSDYEHVLPELEQAIGQGTRRLLLELDGFKGLTPAGLTDELKFDIKHRKDFERIAVVGTALEELGVRLLSPLFSGEVRMFGKGEGAAAEAWLRES
jgi:hypothetical protein